MGTSKMLKGALQWQKQLKGALQWQKQSQIWGTDTPREGAPKNILRDKGGASKGVKGFLEGVEAP